MSGTRLTAVKGMNDLLPEESGLWQRIEATARRVFALYGFEEIRTPLVEPTGLFVRGIGEDTDIVGKEMYTFTDRGDESLTLRPEGTAGAVRAYVEHDRHAVDPIQKWFYLGAMFRRERPQKGRYRQFHQIGAELFGSAEPRADVELIAMVHRFLVEAGVQDVALRLNSLGDAESRPGYRDALLAYFAPHADKLGETDRQRLQKNPLRLLDSKDPATIELARAAPSTLDHLSPAGRAHFDAVTAGLSALGVPFEIDPRIVRGLDYYSRTTFEFVARTGLGAQATVCGGGRYDGLVEELGGPATPAIGFAVGVERLAILLDSQKNSARRGPDLFLGVLGDKSSVEALRLAEACRAQGVCVELSLKSNNPGSQLKRAHRLGARLAVVLGEGELASGEVRLKTMASGEERVVKLADLPAAARVA
jgi:histidyl-tRNA synthetase